MIVLDTNVISELFRPHPHELARGWVDALDASTLYLTSITAAELRGGVEKLPDGVASATLARASSRP